MTYKSGIDPLDIDIDGKCKVEVYADKDDHIIDSLGDGQVGSELHEDKRKIEL